MSSPARVSLEQVIDHDRRPRRVAQAAFPVPRRRLAIVSVGGADAVTRKVGRMAHQLEWSSLTITDPDQLAWAIRVNKPALALVVGDGGVRSTTVLVEQIRATDTCPVSVIDDLSASATVTVLAAGADTVHATDTPEEELAARLLALVRRNVEGSPSGARFLTSGDLQVDLWRKRATLDRRQLALSATEFRLLVCLMENAGRAVAGQRILHRVWGRAGGSGVNTLRISITRLRKKLGEDSRRARYICSVRGVGYVFAPPVIEAADLETRAGTADGETLMMERLAAKCEELSAGQDVETAAQRIVGALVSEGTADAVGLHLTSGGSLKLIAHHGYSAAWEEAARDLRLMDSRFASIQAVTTAEPVQILRLRKEGFPGTTVACSAEPPGTYLFVPMKSGGTVVGTMGVLRHSTEPFGPMAISYLRAVAALCGTCLAPRRIADGGDAIVDGGDAIVDGGDAIVDGRDAIVDGRDA